MSDTLTDGERAFLGVAHALFPQTKHLPDDVVLGKVPEPLTLWQQADLEVFREAVRAQQDAVHQKQAARIAALRERIETLKGEP
jgi:hypothetical protein